MVTTQNQSATTAVLAFRQRLGNAGSAARTDLSRASGIDPDSPFTSLFRFVNDLPEQDSPSRVEDRLRKIGASHPLDLELLEADQLVGRHQPFRDVMTKVTASAGDALVTADHGLTRLAPIARPPFLVRQLALDLSQLLLRFFQPARIVDRLPIRQGEEV